jgi:hypothetical protein
MPVPATLIRLTSSHSGLIAENVDVTLTCLTDEGNPTPNITWMENTRLVTETDIAEIIGNYAAKKIKSWLKITTDRTLNGAKYQCFNGALHSQEYI